MASIKVEAGPAIGIDLGTTYSCVAVLQHDHIEIVPNGQGNRTTPSCVAFTKTDRLVGDAAVNQCFGNPVNTIFGVKRLMGREFNDPCVQNHIQFCPFKVIAGPENRPNIAVDFKCEKKQFYPEEISAMILANMREVAESYLGTAVTNTVVTVPAYFNDKQRRTTRDAGRIAGLNVMRIINEPTAAAIAYRFLLDGKGYVVGSGGSSKNILVFDLGGGTFDVSVLRMEGNRMEVKATAGDTSLGGDDFDNNMVSHFIEQFERKHNYIKMDIRANPRALRRLKSACERAKRVLSFATHTVLEVECFHEGIDFESKISRAKFEELNLELFSKCLTVLEQCLDDAKLKKEHVDEVVLVGGSTRIPRIQQMVQEFFHGKELYKSINPDEAVAYGAAVQAAKLVGEGGKKAQDLVLIDVVPLSLGVANHSGSFSVVIPRNTPIPVTKSINSSTVSDNQESVLFGIYEGERSMFLDNNFLGEFTIHGLPPEPAGRSQFVLTFVIDADGVLEVTAEQQKHRLRGQITITNETGRLNAEDIDKMIQEAETLKASDKKRMEKAVAKSDLEVLLCNLKFRITKGSTAAGLSTANKARLDIEIARASAWLEKNQDADVAEFKDRKAVVDSIWNAIAK